VNELVEPFGLGPHTAPSRVVFGPHETNLGDGRSIGPRHVAYYAARAAGGAGVLVTETASVHPSDWPYERAPSAAACGPGWRSVADACRPHGTVVLAGLGHAGGQGSSAFSQSVLWAPSAVADVASREQPMAMERPEIAALVEGFASSARIAVDAGLDGVELDVGPLSVLRQFHSGLTNLREDDYGRDRLLLTREVVAAVRRAVGGDRLVALRLSCDELAPWAGVTPEQAAEQVDALAATVNLVTVVRGGPYSSTAYRPDAHTPDGFNLGLCGAMRRAAGGRVPVVLQGSVVDPAMAATALADGTADLVEMTRAQIADPDLVAKVRAGAAPSVRPCILCNQACRVRDDRNPLVSCVGEPRAGHETVDPDPGASGPDGPDPDVDALVVGAGPAGLECARVLALRGHRVRVVERADRVGGALVAAALGPGRQRLADLPAWLGAECDRLGVQVATGVEATVVDLDAARAAGTTVVLATGGRPAPLLASEDGTVVVVDAAAALAGGADALPGGPVLVHDTVGGPIGVGVAEWLAGAGRDVALVTADQIAGTLLSRTGDLADANTRLQQAGVRRELRALVRRLADGAAHLEDPWTGAARTVPAAVVVDCGHRLPEETLYQARPGTLRAGDCVAPRSVLEAVLEGRRVALELCALAPAAAHHTPRIHASTGATA
jgi:mycofactocin system FadH/OYE family oxidoreductase 1